MSLQRSCIAALRPELLAQKRCSLAFASRARRSLTFETVFPVSRDRLAHGQPRRGLRLRPPLARAREDPQARAPDRPRTTQAQAKPIRVFATPEQHRLEKQLAAQAEVA